MSTATYKEVKIKNVERENLFYIMENDVLESSTELSIVLQDFDRVARLKNLCLKLSLSESFRSY